MDGSENWLNWVVRLRESAVAIGYTQATIRASHAFLGYQLFPRYWRQGLGTAAVRLTVNRVFAMSDVQEVHALVDTRNLASSSLMRRLQFSIRQTIIAADHFKGRQSDEHEFVMSRSDWSQRCRMPSTAADRVG